MRRFSASFLNHSKQIKQQQKSNSENKMKTESLEQLGYS